MLLAIDTGNTQTVIGLFDGDELRRFVNVYVNDEDVRYLGSLETEVADGDTVSILPSTPGARLATPATARHRPTVPRTPRPSIEVAARAEREGETWPGT